MVIRIRNPGGGRIAKSHPPVGIVRCVRKEEPGMAENKDALKHWYRSRIHQQHREANRLAIELGLEARDKEDIQALADTMESLDTAVKILERARSQLVTA